MKLLRYLLRMLLSLFGKTKKNHKWMEKEGVINYERLREAFSPEAIRLFLKWEKNLSSLGMQKRELITLLDGYPSDMRSNSFKQSDELNSDGWDCHEKKQYQKALTYYDKALKLTPEFSLVWNNKGLAHFRLGNFEKAKDAYLEAIRINPRFIKPYSNLGILYFELKGNKNEASSWFRKALALDPNYQRAWQYLNMC